MSLHNRSFYLTAAFLWLGHFSVDVMIGFWAVYKTIAHLDLAMAGLISALCAFLGEGMQILFGPLSDRGHRKLLIMGGLLATIASTFLAYTTHYGLLCLLFLLTCLGSGAFHPAAGGLMGSLSPHRKGLLIALFATGGTMGMAMSQIIFTYSFFGWGGHTALLAFPILALVLMIFLFRLPEPPPSDASVKHSFSMRQLLAFFKIPALRNLYISQVCNQTLLWGSIFFLPDILTMRGYDSWISLGFGNFMFVLGASIMMIPAGYFADRYSCRKVILASLGLGTLLFYFFLFSPFLSSPLLLGVLFLLGASIGVVNPIAVTLGQKLTPANPSMVSAFLMGMVWCVSEGLGQGGGGLLTKLFTDDAPARALAIMGVAFLIGMYAALKLPAEEQTFAQASETTN